MAPKKRPAKKAGKVKKAPVRKPRPAKARSETSVMDVMATIKQPMALDLRMKGHTFREIAAELDVDVSTAHRYVKAALEELAELTHDKAKHLRAMELARLDGLLAKVWPFATGDLSALVAQLRERQKELAEVDPKAAKKGALAALIADLVDGVPQDAYLKRALNIIQLRARLLGLEAPVKHAHTDPTGEEERQVPYAFPMPPGLSLEEWQKAAARAAAKPGGT